MTSNLTAKQEKFCHEFLIDLNATQAATRAGYSAKTAGAIGFELLKKPQIQSQIEINRVEVAKSTGITPERVLQELAKIAFADPRRVMSWGPGGVKLRPSDELTDDEAAIVSEVSESTTKGGGSMRVKLHDKLAALDKIGRHLGMFAPRLEAAETGVSVQTAGGGFTGTLEELLITLRKVTISSKPDSGCGD